ncbi:MAG: hypothetical protein R6V39_08900 [Desulfovibrionales bacterium]
MGSSKHLEFYRKPSMARTLWQGAMKRGAPFPDADLSKDVSVSWRDIRVPEKHLKAFCRICDIEQDNVLPVFYPFTYVYPCMLRLASLETFPVSMFKMLNTRSRVTAPLKLSVDERLNVDCRISGYRYVTKGMEIDLHAVVSTNNQAAWESIRTFFVRTPKGNTDETSSRTGMQAIDNGQTIAQWYLPAKERFRFARICGDSNGIHYSKWYARLLGFRRDFAQPLRIISKAIENLPLPKRESGMIIDIDYKGPVYYNHHIQLKYGKTENAEMFDVYCQNNPRPCIAAAITKNCSIS